MIKREENELNFRTLEADEIECRAILVNNSCIEIFLHCRAETCTKLLNETVGPMGWEKEYTNNNRNCIVRIWDERKNRMIAKEDCGGSPTEVEGLKGQASNGFKRVCALGWGLGIELYSQPKIRISVNDDNTTLDRHGTLIVCENYSVSKITFDENKKITFVEIVDSTGQVVYPVKKIVNSEEVVPTDNVVLENADADADECVEDKVDSEDVNVADNTQESEIIENLPDNTDGFEEPEDCTKQVMPFETESPAKVIEREARRTNTSIPSILQAMKIDSLEKVDEVEAAVVDSVIAKLKARPDYKKKAK